MHERFNLSRPLRTNRNQIKPDLDGKIMVSVGNQDNFLLNYAVRMLDGEMMKLNSPFVFNLLSGESLYNSYARVF